MRIHALAALSAASLIALAGATSPALGKGPRTITVKTTQSSPFSFTGVPRTLAAGTYIFRYVNTSSIAHNLRVGVKATPVASASTKSITVTLKKGKVRYFCEPHATMMKGTITVT